MSAATTRPTFEIRNVRQDDVDGLIALCREHAAYERAAYDAIDKRAALEKALFGSPHKLRAWVAEVDRELIGYSTASTQYSTWAACEYTHMDCLFVRQTWRNLGAGLKLFEAVLRHARLIDSPEVQWQTPQWNTDAIRFYQRTGAVCSEKVRFTLQAG